MKKILLLFENNFFKLSVQNIILYYFICIMIGFPLAIATLLVPVRWIATVFRHNHWGYENLAVKLIILFFIVITAIISLFLTKFLLKKSGIYTKLTIIAIMVLLPSITLWLWLQPEIICGTTITNNSINSRCGKFTFGPYPTEKEFIELKKEGYTVVISLLHPFIPFEGKLLDDEKRIINKIGLKLIHIPMLPWISENKEALEKIKELVAKCKPEQYYVHCYLGQDRINLVKKLLNKKPP